MNVLFIRDIAHRLNIITVVILLVFGVLVSRLGYLQVMQGKYYAGLADGNRIRLIPSLAPRGTFYDRNSRTMVSVRPAFGVSILSLAHPVSEEVVIKLAGILNVNPAEINDKLAEHHGAFESVRIKEDVGSDIVTKIQERHDELPGVVIEVQPMRNYLNGEMAAHVFGYVSEISAAELEKKQADGYKAGDIIGKYGLEKLYDKELRGTDGGNQVEVDVSGRPVQVLGKKEPVAGDNLFLTLDYRIQKAAEAAVDEQLHYLQTQTEYTNAKAAVAIAMNPKTGEILAMVSRPAFNPNLFVGGISSKDWNLINNNLFHPMDNRAISGEYPPGSTFKIVTGTAALELGKVTAEEKILDTGQFMDKRNSGGEALGWLSFKEAFSKSDDVYFYQMGERLGIDNLEKYARMYGLGEYTGIDLPGEANGLVANRQYKQKVFGQDWYLSETLDAAIGQGFQLVTPLQILQVISQVANGGHRYRPFIVSKIVSPDGEVIKTFPSEERGHIQISQRTLTLIRESMRDVALEGGTAAQIFQDFPIPIAGKTGTVENPHGKDHGVFVAYAPYDDPRIAVVVVVEQGGFGSSSAAPIAKKILEAAFNINQVQSEGAKIAKPGTPL